MRGVYLLTGESDEVAPATKIVGNLLKKAKVPVRVNIAKGMGHELARTEMNKRYAGAVAWLASR